jgi:hypothetical protein
MKTSKVFAFMTNLVTTAFVLTVVTKVTSVPVFAVVTPTCQKCLSWRLVFPSSGLARQSRSLVTDNI